MAKLKLCQEIFDLIYPVGSIYISTNTTNPSTLFGGSWERVKGKFLLGADDNTYINGATGGSLNHNHNLSDNAYAKITGFTATRKLIYKELSGKPSWGGNFGGELSSMGNQSATSTYGPN